MPGITAAIDAGAAGPSAGAPDAAGGAAAEGCGWDWDWDWEGVGATAVVTAGLIA